MPVAFCISNEHVGKTKLGKKYSTQGSLKNNNEPKQRGEGFLQYEF